MTQVKKIYYVANVRMPTEKAHGAQIMHMCAAFVRAGAGVELIVPQRRTAIREEPFRYYAIETHFPIRRLPTLDLVSFGPLGFMLQTFSFALSVAIGVRPEPEAVIYGRDEAVLFVLSVLGMPVVWESHTGSWNFFARFVSRRAVRVIVISNGLKDFYQTRGVSAEKLHTAHDGIDVAAFAHPQSKQDSRARLGLPRDKKIALYAGRLDGWKGIKTLLEASLQLSPEISIAIIGGEPAEIEHFSSAYPTVLFLGYRPYRELADNLSAADALILPNTGKDVISAQFTSPLKLFAYMAAQRPIVASDLPSIREVLSEETAFFTTPDDPQSLAQGVEYAVREGEEAVKKARAARERVAQYDWVERARTVLGRI